MSSRIKTFVFNPFQENTYLIIDETKKAIVIDPGCYERHEQVEFDDYIKEEGIELIGIYSTHSHIDHVLGNAHIQNKYKTPLMIFKKDEETLKSVKSYSSNYGFHQYQEAEISGYFEENEMIEVGDTHLKVMFTPGHAPGHVVFINEKDNYVINGDVLFQSGIGRTDLPGGDFDTLIQSIHQKMFKLPDDMVVYTGHGQPTTIGTEKKFNPFCALK